jgi:hypothetical protein
MEDDFSFLSLYSFSFGGDVGLLRVLETKSRGKEREKDIQTAQKTNVFTDHTPSSLWA